MTEHRPEQERFRIVEEVPGVPENERWFVDGPGMFSHPNQPYFKTLREAKEFLKHIGVAEYDVEPFEL